MIHGQTQPMNFMSLSKKQTASEAKIKKRGECVTNRFVFSTAPAILTFEKLTRHLSDPWPIFFIDALEDSLLGGNRIAFWVKSKHREKRPRFRIMFVSHVDLLGIGRASAHWSSSPSTSTCNDQLTSSDRLPGVKWIFSNCPRCVSKLKKQQQI